MKRWIVIALEWSCNYVHWFTFRRPWIWLPIKNGYCLLATWSYQLDQRWGTGEWKVPEQ